MSKEDIWKRQNELRNGPYTERGCDICGRNARLYICDDCAEKLEKIKEREDAAIKYLRTMLNE